MLAYPPGRLRPGGGYPTGAVEAGEVVVEGHDRGALLDRQRSEVRVVREVATDAHVDEQATDDPGVIRTGRQDDRGRRGEPGVDPIERCVDASGEGNRSTFVASRTNASSASQAKPMVSLPDSAPSSQVRDRSW